MTKKELRKLYKKKRMDLSEKDKMRLNDLLLIQFQKISFPDVNVLLTYCPMENAAEPNTFLFSDFLAFRLPALQTAYPRMINSTFDMDAILVNDETEFVNNDYGIEEPLQGEKISPEEIDLVFIPMLAFDEQGYRVGYGKGYYDRYLAQCRSDVLKIGFSFFEAEPRIDDINEFDVPLNYCITPMRIYEF